MKPNGSSLTVSQLKAKARKANQFATEGKPSAASCITTSRKTAEGGITSEDLGNLQDAFLKYLLAANLMTYAVRLPDSQKGKESYRQASELQEFIYKVIMPRIEKVEIILKERDERESASTESSLGADSNQAFDLKPGGSIADRMRSLEGAGMSVNPSKRFSRDIKNHPPIFPLPPLSPGDPLEPVMLHPGPTPSPQPSPISTPSSPALTGGSIASLSYRASSHSMGPGVQRLSGTSSNTSPLSPPTEEFSSMHIQSASEFSQSFPSIDQLDENYILPSVPRVAPVTSSLPSVPSSKVGAKSSLPPPPTPPNDLNAEYLPDRRPFHVAPFDPSPRPASTPIPSVIRHQTPDSPTAQDLSLPPGDAPKYRTINTPQSPPLYTIPITQPPSTQVLNGTRQTPKVELSTVSSVYPKTFQAWHQAGHKLLLLDVRTREDFDKERVNVDEVVCLEPSILMRHEVSSVQIESALVISPPSEQVLFNNRDKFDAVVIMDAASTAIPPPPSSLSALVRAIYEVEFHKALKRPPILLVGGMNAWIRDLGDKEVIRGKDGFVSDPSHSTPLENPTITNGPRTTHTSNMGYPRDSISPKQSQSNGDEYGRTTATTVNGKLSHTGSSPKPVQYPQLASARPLTTPTANTGSGSFYGSSNGPIVHPPPRVSLSGPRRRSEYFEQSQYPYSGSSSAVSRPSIDYPALHSQDVLSQPPPALTSSSERQDSRPRHIHHGQSFSTVFPAMPPTIVSSYPVTSWPDVEIGISGLKNLGNTCYMNSTLQCLSATVPFARFFTDGRWKKAVNMLNPLGTRGKVAEAFASIVHEMWRGEHTYLSPNSFRKSICQYTPQFAGTDQHDSQEFLSSLLDGLHEDLNRILTKPSQPALTPEREAELETLPQQIASAQEWAIYRMRNDSLVVDYFQGQFRNRLQCMTCGQTSTTYNAFMYLSLPIPTGKKEVGLYQCLDAFVKQEIMEKDDAWFCPRCKLRRKATKTLSLSRMPPVLLIHLKRFSFKGPFTDKLESLVQFPLKGLDLTNYLPPPLPPGAQPQPIQESRLSPDDSRRQEPPYKYDLYGVTNHFGNLSSGHYTSFIASKGGWKYCEDSSITTADKKDVVARPAYILFYKRV